VLLDPPRAGALEVLPRLAELGAARLVYVSCHPATLARDLGLLVREYGYRLAAAGVVDMFPHTNHVESVAVLDGPVARLR
jgi:23S rRNA (uracil1939-C5)-methyltransferase